MESLNTQRITEQHGRFPPMGIGLGGGRMPADENNIFNNPHGGRHTVVSQHTPEKNQFNFTINNNFINLNTNQNNNTNNNNNDQQVPVAAATAVNNMVSSLMKP